MNGSYFHPHSISVSPDSPSLTLTSPTRMSEIGTGFFKASKKGVVGPNVFVEQSSTTPCPENKEVFEVGY